MSPVLTPPPKRRGTGCVVAAVAGGCRSMILIVVAFLAVWQFLAPADRKGPAAERDLCDAGADGALAPCVR